MAREHFQALDGLRGVAALAVLVGHASDIFVEHSAVPRKLLAVVFFFLLSGFVIAYAYEAKLAAGLKLSRFLLCRGIRLYPMVIVGATLAFVQFLAFNLSVDHARFGVGALHEVGRGGYYYALSSAVLPCLTCGRETQLFPINPPGWSLFYELIAYGMFGAIAFRLRDRSLAMLTAAMLAVASYASIRFGAPPFHWLAAHAFGSFSLGVLLYRGRGRWPNALPGVNVFTLGAVLIAFCCIPRSVGWIVDLAAMWLVFPLLIVAGATAGGADRLSRWLGDLSYPLYISHWPVLMLVWQVTRGADPRWPAAIACVAAVGVAEASRRWIDLSARAALTRALERWEGRRVAAGHPADCGAVALTQS